MLYKYIFYTLNYCPLDHWGSSSTDLINRFNKDTMEITNLGKVKKKKNPKTIIDGNSHKQTILPIKVHVFLEIFNTICYRF